jgi:hypothetical protein
VRWTLPGTRSNANGVPLLVTIAGNGTQPVVLDVFDVTGRRVRHLTKQTAAAGNMQVRWDGRSDRGSRVAPGIYFARLHLGADSVSRRVLLLR